MAASSPAPSRKPLALLFSAGLVLPLADADISGGEAARAYAHLAEMQSAYSKVADYTTTFHKQERIGGKLMPPEKIEIKFAKPLRVYLKWVGEVNQGQEAIYVRGWNGGKIRVHKGSFPDVTVDLDPHSKLARKGSRHPITEAGFGHTIGIIAGDARRSREHPEDGTRYVVHGESMVHGALSRCIEQIVPAAVVESYYTARAKVCFNVRTRMPTRVTSWDTHGKLLEDYGYEDTRLNVGLGDLDFSPDNPAYNF